MSIRINKLKIIIGIYVKKKKTGRRRKRMCCRSQFTENQAKVKYTIKKQECYLGRGWNRKS